MSVEKMTADESTAEAKADLAATFKEWEEIGRARLVSVCAGAVLGIGGVVIGSVLADRLLR